MSIQIEQVTAEERAVRHRGPKVAIQWRLRKAERREPKDATWKEHSECPRCDADTNVATWNEHDRFFEYRRKP